MQERFLARRILHFLPDEIISECKKGRRCECGTTSRENMVARDCQELGALRDLQAASDLTSVRDFARLWMEIVWDYSKMDLSVPTDRLPALSGLAAWMDHPNHGTYIAKFCELHLPVHLGWSMVPRDSLDEDNSLLARSYCGPTFSWSSHTYQIECMPPEAHPICTLQDCETELATPNPYGEVLSAHITLRGRSIPAN